MDSGQLHELRTRLDLTQQQFATALGWSMATISRWEHAHSAPVGGYLAVYELIRAAEGCSGPGNVRKVLLGASGVTAELLQTLVKLGNGRKHAS